MKLTRKNQVPNSHAVNISDGDKLGRRRTLQVLGIGGLSAAGLLSLGCGDNKKSAGDDTKTGGDKKAGADATGCDAPVDAQSKKMRKTLQYKEKASDPEKICSKCAQYEKDKFGDCGGCKLFGGPVKPEGGCLSFAPIGGGDAAPSATATG